MTKENIIHIPVLFNDGTHVPEATHHAFRECLISMYGGFSVQQVMGGWRDPEGKDIIEPMYRFIVAVGGKEDHKLFWDLAEEAKEIFQQQSIYAVINGKVEFI